MPYDEAAVHAELNEGFVAGLAMFAIRDKLPQALQNGLIGDDPCKWTFFDLTCPLLECRLYNGTLGHTAGICHKVVSPHSLSRL